MKWNWQCSDWPGFSFDAAQLQMREDRFLMEAGRAFGAATHFTGTDHLELTVELISTEAEKSSAIEGELLNRDSLQSSIRRNLGLKSDIGKIPPAEQGMADMMLDLYHHFDQPLTHETLHHWHEKLMEGRRELIDVGRYRTGKEPMQVISGYLHAPTVHFEAPPSDTLPDEMNRFVDWFNDTAPGSNHSLPALTRAAITHLYFVSLHPYEDGNGRIGRALSEKALSQAVGEPSLIALSQVIERQKKEYYEQLKRHNHTLQIDGWLSYFSETVAEAMAYTQELIFFLIGKGRFYQRLHAQLNDRQKKVIARMFKAGIDGFQGGLSAENYIALTRTSRATATRDLQQLVELGALIRTGKLKGTRYRLNLEVI
jgi:Fic family protein